MHDHTTGVTADFARFCYDISVAVGRSTGAESVARHALPRAYARHGVGTRSAIVVGMIKYECIPAEDVAPVARVISYARPQDLADAIVVARANFDRARQACDDAERDLPVGA